MKVLMINKFLYPKGGDAVSMFNTGTLLKQQGHQVIYWGMAHPDNPSYEWEEQFVANVNYHQSGIKEQLAAAGKLLYSQEAKKKISAVIKSEHPDIVHLHNFAHQISPSILDVFKKNNLPTVMTMHDYKMVCPVYTLYNQEPCERCQHRQFYWCTLKKCTKGSFFKSLLNTVEMVLHHHILGIEKKINCYMAPSQFLKNKTISMGLVGDVRHLPNFINCNDSEPSYQGQEPSLVYFGRLSKEKGIDYLIDAVQDLGQIKLKIIGDGPMKASLISKLVKLDKTNIEILPYMNKVDLHQEIKKSMAVVLPSIWYENNPMAVLEAFALGKPVIASAIGGLPELVQHGKTGLLVEPGNSHDLKEKIIQLLSQPQSIRQMGQAARKLVETKYSAQLFYEQLIKIYQDMIDNNKNNNDYLN